MSPSVYHQITLASKSLLASFTLEWFCMLPTMTSEAGGSNISFCTEFTLVDHFIGAIWTTPGNPVHRLVHWGRIAIDSNAFHIGEQDGSYYATGHISNGAETELLHSGPTTIVDN